MLTVETLESRTLLNGNGIDSTFGTRGDVVTDFGGNDVAAKVLMQPNGKIVAAGTSTSGGVSSFALTRYNSDGSLDTTFGTNGKITGPLGSATGAALDANGEIIVAGQDFTTHFVVARYTSGGALDSTFGTAGVVTTAIVNATNASVAVQPTDGKIIVAGYSAGLPPTSFSTIDVIRYNANGTLDTTFGTGGVANAGNGTIVNQVLIQTDGKIVVAGNDEPGMTSRDTALFVKRLNSNGSVDNTVQPFVDLGVGSNLAFALALQTDGKFLELGSANGEPILVRLNSNGSLDTSFGVRGQVFTDVGRGPGLAIQDNGQIIVAGARGTDNFHVFNGHFEAARYNADGSLDTRFGDGVGNIGTVTAFFAAIQTATITAQDVVLQPLDGKIIVAGEVGGDFALARFLGGPSASLIGTPNQRFVEQAYLDLLGRAAEPNGLAAWSGLLDRGQASRAQVALAIEGSPEAHARVVEGLCERILHRAANSFDPWWNFLNSGGTAAQLAVVLLSSDEYMNDNGNTTSGFVTGLYRDVLHRSHDAAGAQGWIGYLNNGISRAAVAAAILVSPESDQDLVEGFYHRFLNRAGESAGISGFVSRLQQGANWEGIEAIFLGSDEYFARAQA